MPDLPRDRPLPAPRHPPPLPPIATPSLPTLPPPHQISTPPVSSSQSSEYIPDRPLIARTTTVPARSSLPLSCAPAAIMPRHSNHTPKRARRRLVLRLPHYSTQDKAAESTLFKRNTGHLAQCAWDGCRDFLSLFFLRFILPDSAVEHILLYITAHCSQAPPCILQNEPAAAADDDDCLEAWLGTSAPGAAAAHLYPPPPDARPRAPRRPQVDPREDDPRDNENDYDIWLAANPHPLFPNGFPPASSRPLPLLRDDDDSS